jgi:ABC-type polysaccharide/polyol phosphate export permease
MSASGALAGLVTGAARAGLAEILDGARHWRVWHLIGSGDLRHRYVRSVLGQFWVVLSTALMIGAMSGVWSLLWNQPLDVLVPFIGIGLVILLWSAQKSCHETIATVEVIAAVAAAMNGMPRVPNRATSAHVSSLVQTR